MLNSITTIKKLTPALAKLKISLNQRAPLRKRRLVAEARRRSRKGLTTSFRVWSKTIRLKQQNEWVGRLTRRRNFFAFLRGFDLPKPKRSVFTSKWARFIFRSSTPLKKNRRFLAFKKFWARYKRWRELRVLSNRSARLFGTKRLKRLTKQQLRSHRYVEKIANRLLRVSEQRRFTLKNNLFKLRFRIRRSRNARPALIARARRVIRLLRATPRKRRRWWRILNRMRQTFRYKAVKVFRGNSVWRHPYSRRKIMLSHRCRKRRRLRQQISKHLLIKVTTRRRRRWKRRYFFFPRKVIGRLRFLHFCQKGFWRRLNSLVWIRVRFTLNNVFISISNRFGRTFMTLSSGAVGFRGPAKLTTYALEKMAESVVKFILRRRRSKNVYLIFNSGSIGYKSKLLVEKLINGGLIVKFLTVKDLVPHNGVRPRKAKRR